MEVQQSTKVLVMVEAQRRAMEIKRRESKSVANRRHAILDKAALLEKDIKIPDLERFMWTQMKQNYDKHVERMENWKDITKEEDWASKTELVPLFLMDWEVMMSNVMLKFLNTFFIKGANIYFGHMDKVYVISK